MALGISTFSVGAAEKLQSIILFGIVVWCCYHDIFALKTGHQKKLKNFKPFLRKVAGDAGEVGELSPGLP